MNRVATDPFLQVTTDDHEQLHKEGGTPVLGTYALSPTENRRPMSTKKKWEQIFIYYWQGDALKGEEEMTGWWIGPVLGREHVHATHSSNTFEPPADEWSVPYDHPTRLGIIRITKSKVKPFEEYKEKKMRKRSRDKQATPNPEKANKAAQPEERTNDLQQSETTIETQK